MRVHVRRRLTAPLLLQDWVIRRKLSLCSNHFKKRERREKRKSRPTLIHTVKKDHSHAPSHSLETAHNKIHQLSKNSIVMWIDRAKRDPKLKFVSVFQQAMHISADI